MSNPVQYRQLVQQYFTEHVDAANEPTPTQIDAAHAFASGSQAAAVAKYVAKQLGMTGQGDRDAHGEEVVAFIRPASATSVAQ